MINWNTIQKCLFTFILSHFYLITFCFSFRCLSFLVNFSDYFYLTQYILLLICTYYLSHSPKSISLNLIHIYRLMQKFQIQRKKNFVNLSHYLLSFILVLASFLYCFLIKLYRYLKKMLFMIPLKFIFKFRINQESLRTSLKNLMTLTRISFIYF
jgi:hypothetical protein